VESLITSGAVVWLILGIMAVEASLGNMGTYTIAACLGLSFICHGVEIWFWFKAQQRKLAP
jgi:hypothetical protein